MIVMMMMLMMMGIRSILMMIIYTIYVYMYIYACFDAHYVCFADTNPNIDIFHHRLSNPSSQLRNDWELLWTEGAAPPKLVSNKDPKGKNHAKVAGWPLVEKPAKYGSLNKKQMWNRCELKDYHATDWLGCHCTTCCTLNTFLVVDHICMKLWVADSATERYSW